VPGWLRKNDTFPKRHIGPSDAEIAEMCEAVGVKDINELMEQTIPSHIRRECDP
jgi:glycine dehydrogenase